MEEDLVVSVVAEQQLELVVVVAEAVAAWVEQPPPLVAVA